MHVFARAACSSAQKRCILPCNYSHDYSHVSAATPPAPRPLANLESHSRAQGCTCTTESHHSNELPVASTHSSLCASICRLSKTRRRLSWSFPALISRRTSPSGISVSTFCHTPQINRCKGGICWEELQDTYDTVASDMVAMRETGRVIAIDNKETHK